MVKATHRSTVLSLLSFDPGEVQQELIATFTGAKVYYLIRKKKDKNLAVIMADLGQIKNLLFVYLSN
jgi:hypothetical protein